MLEVVYNSLQINKIQYTFSIFSTLEFEISQNIIYRIQKTEQNKINIMSSLKMIDNSKDSLRSLVTDKQKVKFANSS